MQYLNKYSYESQIAIKLKDRETMHYTILNANTCYKEKQLSYNSWVQTSMLSGLFSSDWLIKLDKFPRA